MWKLIEDLKKDREQKKRLLGFLEEINKNLEQYYVMFQINRLRYFRMERWEKLQSFPEISFDKNVTRYAERLTAYNQTLSEFRDYEQWYSSDSKNKNKENGMILHKKNTAAKEKFKGLEQVIIPAREAVTHHLIDWRILKS